MPRIYKAASNWTGTIGSGGIPDSTTTTIPLSSTAGLTDGEWYLISIDRVDANGNKTPSKWEVVAGQLSGTNLVNCTRGVEGTAQAHSAGAVVEILMTATHWNELKDYLEAEHNPDGTHGDITANSVTTNSVATDTITEKTANSGVTIEGVLLKNQTIVFPEQSSTPANPATGKQLVWAKNDGNIYVLKPSGSYYYVATEELGGWIPVADTWSYSSYDATTKTGVITVPSGATTKYSAGMRVKFTQPTDGVKYGIITSVSSTSLTVFFGTDYDLDNEAITDVYYSSQKAPFGFNLNPDKWKIEITNSASNEVTSPTVNVWYNAGGINIQVPVGGWKLEYSAFIMAQIFSGGNTNVFSTLSTSSGSETYPDLTCAVTQNGATAGDFRSWQTVYRNKYVFLSSTTTYYLNIKTSVSGTSVIGVRGDIVKAIIRAVCAYL